MRHLFIISLGIFLICLSACQKELSISLSNQQPDSLGNTSAPRFKTINVSSSDFNNPNGYTYAPKYDSVTRKLNIYLDDPSTSGTIYDSLEYVYEFNAAGYLIKKSVLDDNQVLSTQLEIMRNPSNEIQMIVEHDVYDQEPGVDKDTLFFSYQNSGGQLTVKDSLAMAGYEPNVEIMKFNSSNQMVSIKRALPTPVDVQNYIYDGQGNLTDELGTFDTTHYVYDSHPIAPEWKGNEGYFLGKDAWLLKNVEPFFSPIHWLTFLYGDFFEEWHSLLFTHPLSGYHAHGLSGAFLTDYYDNQVNFTNTYSAGNLPLTMASSGPFGSTITFTITYN